MIGVRRGAAVALLAVGFVPAAQAQQHDDRSFLSALTTGSISSWFSPASKATPEWSGESGASGNPTMTADAIRAAAANFQACLAGLRPEAMRRGVSAATFAAHVPPLQ